MKIWKKFFQIFQKPGGLLSAPTTGLSSFSGGNLERLNQNNDNQSNTENLDTSRFPIKTLINEILHKNKLEILFPRKKSKLINKNKDNDVKLIYVSSCYINFIKIKQRTQKVNPEI